MKRYQMAGFVFVFVLTLAAISVVYAKDKQEIELATYKKDLTGDHQHETITIMGTPNKDTYKNIEINIVTSKKKEYHIPLTAKEKPSVSFKDLNQDGIKDLFVVSHENDNTNFHLYSFMDDQFTNIGLPEPLSLTAQLENDYMASIVIDKTGEEYKIGLKKHKKSFEQTGLYQKGQLNEPTELKVDSYEQFTPVRMRDMKIGLKASQPIGDNYSGSIIANVISTWKWSNGRWELYKTSVKKTTKQ